MADVQTHSGGCHCGAVTFEADLSLEQVIECNCSHCHAKGLQLAFTTPDRFRLLSGEGSLREYRFNRHVISHKSCETCGVEPFAFGKNPDGSDAVAVNVRALKDIEPNTIRTLPYDGRHQN